MHEGEGIDRLIPIVENMGDHLARAQDFEGKAEKKLSGWGLFGSKFEDAADLFDKSANSFKLAKSCNLNFLQFLRLMIINDVHVVLVKVSEFIRVSGDKAGSTYIKLANCHLKVTDFVLLAYFVLI